MSNQISLQANKLWQIISAPSTAESYKQALAITWTILKEAALLVWLTICLVLVVFDWFWNGSIAAGQNFRTWISSFESTDSNQIATQMGQGFLAAGKSSVIYAVAQAREQLGLPAKETSAITPALPSAPSTPSTPSTPSAPAKVEAVEEPSGAVE